MKCTYEAANGVEAHMVANLLEQENIRTRIDGEYLTGGIGELPAMGLVRVMVDETDFERARQVIEEWETKSPPPRPDTETKRRGYPSGIVWFMAGLVATAVFVNFMQRHPVTEDGVDYDNDGRMDETYTYRGKYLSKVESDRNNDGRTDAVYRYDSRGLIESSQSDDDFDGRFETQGRYLRGELKTLEVDDDLDGKVDRRYGFVDGVLATVTLYAADGYTVRKREFYQHGVLRSADFDADGDGAFDTYYEYDDFGEVASISHK